MIINGEEFKKTLINDNYYVSKSGKLYNIKTNRFLYGTEYNGYIRVTIKKKLVSLHRLVYEAFKKCIKYSTQKNIVINQDKELY